jgi:hypothetical protein
MYNRQAVHAKGEVAWVVIVTTYASSFPYITRWWWWCVETCVGVDGKGVPSPCFRAWLVVLVILNLMFNLCMMRPADEHSIVKEAQEKKDPAAATACQAVARSKGL